jgi:4-hydroxy-3-polyprenylbenzoate decarboxylase
MMTVPGVGYGDAVNSGEENLQRIVVGISGGSGMAYALDLLNTLVGLPVESHVVVTAGARQVIASELEERPQDLEASADVLHKNTDLAAGIASGSYRTVGMVVVPCSSGTLAKIAQGFTDNLLTRAAHVTLKERRPLVLVVRESPLSRPMLLNMLAVHDAGAIVLPAAPSFYHRPKNIGDLIGTVTARALDRVGIEHKRSQRWKEAEG